MCHQGGVHGRDERELSKSQGHGYGGSPDNGQREHGMLIVTSVLHKNCHLNPSGLNPLSRLEFTCQTPQCRIPMLVRTQSLFGGLLATIHGIGF